MTQQTIDLPDLETGPDAPRKPGPCGRCGRRHRPRRPGTPGPHDREHTFRPRMGPCRECGRPSRARDLCSLHYSRMRRAKDRGRCTIPECGEPLRYRGKLYCEEHAICMVPGCPLVNKARRLCRRHYQSLYITPKNRREREKRNNPQGEFNLDGNEWTLPVPEGPEPGTRPHRAPATPASGLQPGSRQRLPEVRRRPHAAPSPEDTTPRRHLKRQRQDGQDNVPEAGNVRTAGVRRTGPRLRHRKDDKRRLAGPQRYSRNERSMSCSEKPGAVGTVLWHLVGERFGFGTILLFFVVLPHFDCLEGEQEGQDSSKNCHYPIAHQSS